VSVRQALLSRIERFSRVRRRVANAAVRCRLAACGFCLGTAGLALLWGWLPGAILNMALFLALAVAVVVLLVKYYRRKVRFRSHLDDAFRMEELAGNLNSRLISALDFTSHEQPTPLMQVVINRAQEDIALDFEQRLDREPMRRYRKRFARALVLFFIVGFIPFFKTVDDATTFDGFLFNRVAANFTRSLFAVSELLFPFVYEVTPKSGTYVHKVGQCVDVAIHFKSRSPGGVTLVEAVGEKTFRHVLSVSDGRAEHTVEGLVEARHYLHFEFGERKSEEVVLVFANAPVLENMQTELVYPSYTRMVPRTLDGIQTRLFGLKGTTITLGFTFSKDLESAKFVWVEDDQLDAPRELNLETAGRFASTSLRHTRNRRASLEVVDKDGLTLDYPIYITFEVQQDEPPRVVIPSSLKSTPEKGIGLKEEGLKLFGFGARMQDDYGVSRCVLTWKKSTLDNPTRVTQQGEVERLVSPPRRKVIQSFQKIFANMSVEPGDLVQFKVRVYDNCVPRAGSAESDTVWLYIYQDDLEDLAIASLHFGSGALERARIAKSRRATSVKAPAGAFTRERVWNEYDAKIETTTKAPVIPGDYAQAVKDYLRLISTAVEKNKEKAPEGKE